MIQRQRFCQFWLHVYVAEFMAKFPPRGPERFAKDRSVAPRDEVPAHEDHWFIRNTYSQLPPRNREAIPLPQCRAPSIEGAA